MKRLGPALLLLAAVICFAISMAEQLSSGEVYDEGSTLRTDAAGTSAFYEALAKTRSKVERNYSPLQSIHAVSATIFVIEVPPGRWNDKELPNTLSALAEVGNRVVVAVKSGDDKPLEIKGWHVKIADDARDSEEESFLWPVHFESCPEWTVIRSDDDHPVVIERRFGKGTIALVGATEPFTNRDLLDSRDTPLLDWAAGTNPYILFDETHLGSNSGGTMMGMMRKLHLQGVIFCLLLAAGLFFWRASVPFPPVPEPAATKGLRILSGTASQEALRNLLERRIPPLRLVAACVQEWTRDHGRRAGPEIIQEIENTVGTTTQPIETWEKIRAITRGANRL